MTILRWLKDALLALPLLLFLLVRLALAYFRLSQKAICDMSQKTKWDFHVAYRDGAFLWPEGHRPVIICRFCGKKGIKG